MEALKRIEALPPARRSSMVGQAGVLRDLRSLPKEDAISWLRQFIHSPVSQDWGCLLNALNADEKVLAEWMRLDKEHALAAADAITARIESSGVASLGSSPPRLIVQLEALAAQYQSPRLKKPLEALRAAATPIPADLAKALQLLFGQASNRFISHTQDRLAQWHSAFHQASGRYSVAVLDWRATESEQQDAISALPVVSQSSSSADLSVEVVDAGGDEIILVVLPAEEMQELKGLVPADFCFNACGLRPNKSFKPNPLRGSA